MPYFDYSSKIPNERRRSSWIKSWNPTLDRNARYVGPSVVDVPKLLTDLGWIYQFKAYLPKDDSWEAEHLLDHNPLHVFGDWTCIMAHHGIEERPMFDMYFCTDLDFVMAKMILL